MSFTPTEKRVLGAMFKLGRWSTVNEISKWADNLSWNTTNITIKRLVRRSVIKKRKVGRKNYYKVNF